MNRLTVVPADEAVYVDGFGYLGFDLSFVPSDVHALQWDGEEGWIERKGQRDEMISTLPDWATQAQALWQAHHDEVMNPPVPPITVNDFSTAIKRHFDAVAQVKQYDGEITLASYVASLNAQWKAEAETFVAWRDSVWQYAYQEFAKFQNGERPMPAIADFIAELPTIQWPS
jgi:hypothetical protein